MVAIKKILIFRENLLPYSETFIKDQVNRLEYFKPFYMGVKFDNKGIIEKNSALLINDGSYFGRLKEILFKSNMLIDHYSKKVKKFNPNLIHAHFGPDGYLASKITNKLGIPLIVTYHGYDATLKEGYLKQVSRVAKNYVSNKENFNLQVTKYIAISNYIKEQMILKNFPENKILVHYTGIDTEYFKPKKDVQRENIVLFVGRLIENKGLNYLIRAFKNVEEVCSESKLVIIGSGDCEEKYKDLAKENLINYEFLGRRTPEEIKDWMNRAKVFCVPSVRINTGASEGLGQVFLEAQAMELPVVSFKTGGIPEAVTHNETGFLASSKDDVQLSTYIIRLLEDQKLWEEFSKKGRKRMESSFDINKNNKKLEQIYKGVINNYGEDNEY